MTTPQEQRPTPRTDSKQTFTIHNPDKYFGVIFTVDVEHARTLERESAALRERVNALKEQRADQLQALGLAEDETTDIAAEIRHIRDEGRAHFHDATKLGERVGELEKENIRRIRHLNRLASWAQQDPTGPMIADKVQEWVLEEIKSALGVEANGADWQPEFVARITSLEKQLRDEKLVSEGLGRLVNDKDKDRIFFRDKVTALEGQLKEANETIERATDAFNRIRALVGATDRDPMPAEHYVGLRMAALKLAAKALERIEKNLGIMAPDGDARAIAAAALTALREAGVKTEEGT